MHSTVVVFSSTVGAGQADDLARGDVQVRPVHHN